MTNCDICQFEKIQRRAYASTRMRGGGCSFYVCREHFDSYGGELIGGSAQVIEA